MTPSPETKTMTEKLRAHRQSLNDHEAMADAQAGCVPCKLCGGKAVITDAGVGAGYYIACENSGAFRAAQGCMITERRLGGWVYNVMDWWNRLHSSPTPAADEVEAVARAIQDAHAPGHPINHVSIYQARAAIAALQARSAEPVGEAKAIIDELNACYLYGVSEKSDALAKRIIAHLSRPAEPAGEEPTCWMIRSRETGIPFWGFVQNHYRSKEEAEKSAQALYDYEPFALYAGPATPTNPERRELGAEPTDAETAAAARRALGTWLSWPDAARDGVPAVDNGKVCSWLQGVPSRLAALSAAPLKEGGQ